MDHSDQYIWLFLIRRYWWKNTNWATRSEMIRVLCSFNWFSHGLVRIKRISDSTSIWPKDFIIFGRAREWILWIQWDWLRRRNYPGFKYGDLDFDNIFTDTFTLVLSQIRETELNCINLNFFLVNSNTTRAHQSYQSSFYFHLIGYIFSKILILFAKKMLQNKKGIFLFPVGKLTLTCH